MRISCNSEFAIDPVLTSLRARGWNVGPYDRPPGADAVEVLRGADIVITSPLDYAAAIGIVDYALVEGFAVTIRGSSGLMRLLFNQGRETITSVAVRAARPFDRIVTQILLAEKHDLEPEFIVFDDGRSVAKMMQAADAVVVSGDESLFHAGGIKAFLDIGDEWEDAIGEALPYLVAWGKVDDASASWTPSICEARDAAVLGLVDAAATSAHPDEASVYYQGYLRGDVSYSLGEDEVRALETFFRYAFFHGFIPEIPAVKYLQ